MADYFTSFCCRLDVLTGDNADHAVQIFKEMQAALERDDDLAIGFEVSVDGTTVGSLLMQDADGFGEPEHVIAFVLRCAEAFDLKGQWGFTWVLWCSAPQVDAFGGGAQLLDLGARKSLAWIDCEHWLASGGSVS